MTVNKFPINPIFTMDQDKVAEFKKKLEYIKKKKEEERKRKEEEELKKKAAEEKEKEERLALAAAEAIEPQTNTSFSIFVNKVHPRVKKEQLEQHFKCCGSIKRVTIICDHYTHVPKGYAYIEFASQEGIDNAMKLNNSILEGQTLEVKIKRPKEIKPRTFRRVPRRRFRRR
ncbi:Polyadenylate-binding protein 2 [Tritrichomonas foetus]|uniref:Polyadenylate-binding protein 2 n=1 Tax=Tritrichomonas foetus TaxID=1144522 RepID=A0A1J4K464_9EUKA|nr:Polyadenylate-binding protein 2 [Tritrichomonas foetus]|eukprot:OHT06241.1 Polyadenylate-binding protein 2 [Tritrichomonas foetus]